jgi:intergrase/recombinase
MFFPRQLLELIEKYRDRLPGKRRIEKVVKKNACLPPSYIRTFAMREIISALGDNDVTRFILSKFGELSVSARHYRDLLEEADQVYPKYVEHVKSLLPPVRV